MPKIGRYKYPAYRLDDVLVEVEKVETALKQGISRRGLIEALGMKWGGAAFEKVAAMRLYGLIEGYGVINRTDLADAILHGLTPDEKRRAREMAWLNVDAIKMVHEIFKGRVPEREEEYLAILAEKSGEKDRAKLPKKAKEVLSLYKKALSDILVEKIPEKVVEKAPEMKVAVAELAMPGIIEIKVEDYYQRLPYTPEGIDLGINFLNLLKSQIKRKEMVEEEKQN